MVKKGLIKKGFVWFALVGCLAGQGTDLLAEQKNIAAGQKKIPADSLVMTVAGKPVLLDEFLFIAQKNSEVDLSDRKSVENYVELFKNFKLKVAEAEAKGLDKTKAFKDELDGYRAQLTASYLSDKAGEEAAVRAEYDRYGEVLELSHILFRLPKQTLSKDTVAVYEQAMQAYERIAQGADFDAVGAGLSAADKAHIGYEYVRSFLPMQSVKAFENAAYAQPVGTVSKPVRTTMGFHLIKIHSRKPNPGKIRVAHILVPFAKDTAAQDTAAVLARAEELYQQAVAGEDFAELAKSFSADSGSAKRGGVLPVLGLGEMIEPFEKAAFALQQPGDISRPVKTRFGYHIIKIVDVKPAQAKPLKEVRAEIEALYQQQAAIRAFAEDAENFSNMVYEQSESLQPVAERFGLKIQTVKNVTRDFEDQLINPNVIEALYGFDVLEDKRNSNAIEVASNTLLSARVTAHHKPTVKTFDEVKGDIVTTLKNQKATQAARAQGSADIAKLLDKKPASAKFGDKTVISRERPGAFAYEVVTAALRPQADKLPTYTGVQTQDGSYFVIEVQSSKKIEASPEQLAMRKAELAQLYSNPEQAAFISGLETKFGTQILKDEYKPGYQPTEDDVTP